MGKKESKKKKVNRIQRMSEKRDIERQRDREKRVKREEEEETIVSPFPGLM